MKAETFLRKVAATSLDAKVIICHGYSEYEVASVAVRKDGTISIRAGKPTQ